MTIKLNHTIVHSRDPRASANFVTGLFGLPAPIPFGPFLCVQIDNEVTLDFLNAEDMEEAAARRRCVPEGDARR